MMFSGQNDRWSNVWAKPGNIQIAKPTDRYVVTGDVFGGGRISQRWFTASVTLKAFSYDDAVRRAYEEDGIQYPSVRKL